MLVKSITWYVLPAAPWASPGFRASDRVGHGAGPTAAGEFVTGAGLLVVPLCGVTVTVTVLVGVLAAPGVALPQAAVSAATQASAAPAIAGRAVRADAVMCSSLCLSGSASRLTSMTLAGPLWLSPAGLGKARFGHDKPASAAGLAGSPS